LLTYQYSTNRTTKFNIFVLFVVFSFYFFILGTFCSINFVVNAILQLTIKQSNYTLFTTTDSFFFAFLHLSIFCFCIYFGCLLISLLKSCPFWCRIFIKIIRSTCNIIWSTITTRTNIINFTIHCILIILFSHRSRWWTRVKIRCTRIRRIGSWFYYWGGRELWIGMSRGVRQFSISFRKGGVIWTIIYRLLSGRRLFGGVGSITKTTWTRVLGL